MKESSKGSSTYWTIIGLVSEAVCTSIAETQVPAREDDNNDHDDDHDESYDDCDDYDDHVDHGDHDHRDSGSCTMNIAQQHL